VRQLIPIPYWSITKTVTFKDLIHTRMNLIWNLFPQCYCRCLTQWVTCTRWGSCIVTWSPRTCCTTARTRTRRSWSVISDFPKWKTEESWQPRAELQVIENVLLGLKFSTKITQKLVMLVLPRKRLKQKKCYCLKIFHSLTMCHSSQMFKWKAERKSIGIKTMGVVERNWHTTF